MTIAVSENMTIHFLNYFHILQVIIILVNCCFYIIFCVIYN